MPLPFSAPSTHDSFLVLKSSGNPKAISGVALDLLPVCYSCSSRQLRHKELSLTGLNANKSLQTTPRTVEKCEVVVHRAGKQTKTGARQTGYGDAVNLPVRMREKCISEAWAAQTQERFYLFLRRMLIRTAENFRVTSK